jgi:hypothetical protein
VSRTDTVTRLVKRAFPWPPPHASATYNIPMRWLRRPGRPVQTLGQISDLLETALADSGYSERGFYRIDDGFAIVTRLEQTNDEGQHLRGANRWVMDHVPTDGFVLSEYIASLFRRKPGHFRVIVFGVTAHPFSQTSDDVARDDVVGWPGKGLSSLPPDLAALPAGKDVRITALVYEFELRDVAGPATFSFPGRLNGEMHMKNSGLLASLRR